MSAVSHASTATRAGAPAPARTRADATLARRSFADGRRRTIAFALLFAAVAYLQPVAYRHSYPTAADRLAFAQSFAGNKAIRLFYGVPHDLLSVGGYTAWRVGGILTLFAAAWGLLAAVAALRGEEESGRTELALAAAIGRGRAVRATLAAIAAAALILWTAQFVALLAAGLPVGGSALLALGVCLAGAVFVGVGAVVSQIADTRRRALELAVAVLSVTFALRVIADTVAGAGWLRWLSPLGWVEEVQAFAGWRPWVRLNAERDVGTGLFSASDAHPPRLVLLSSPAAFALRGELSTLVGWLAGVGAFAFIVGIISKSISAAGISSTLRRELAKLGCGAVVTPAGYLGFSFLFFLLALSLFSCSQIVAVRAEELHGRLETALALPVGRGRWLRDRLAGAAAAAVVISLTAGALAWAGARVVGVDVGLREMLLASGNCFALGVLFLGVGALLYAVVPRIAGTLIYVLAIGAVVWQLFGSLLGAPSWIVKLTPFAHIGFVPEQRFQLGWALAMVGVGAISAIAACLLIRRRDLASD